MRGKWTVFDRRPPPEHAQCLVTNNIKARDAFGNMSHVWIGHPQRSFGPTDSFPHIPPKGTWMIFTDCDRIVEGLTHWMPLPDATVKRLPADALSQRRPE